VKIVVPTFGSLLSTVVGAAMEFVVTPTPA
jgi:hypothetical protein